MSKIEPTMLLSLILLTAIIMTANSASVAKKPTRVKPGANSADSDQDSNWDLEKDLLMCFLCSTFVSGQECPDPEEEDAFSFLESVAELDVNFAVTNDTDASCLIAYAVDTGITFVQQLVDNIECKDPYKAEALLTQVSGAAGGLARIICCAHKGCNWNWNTAAEDKEIDLEAKKFRTQQWLKGAEAATVAGGAAAAGVTVVVVVYVVYRARSRASPCPSWCPNWPCCPRKKDTSPPPTPKPPRPPIKLPSTPTPPPAPTPPSTPPRPSRTHSPSPEQPLPSPTPPKPPSPISFRPSPTPTGTLYSRALTSPEPIPAPRIIHTPDFLSRKSSYDVDPDWRRKLAQKAVDKRKEDYMNGIKNNRMSEKPPWESFNLSASKSSSWDEEVHPSPDTEPDHDPTPEPTGTIYSTKSTKPDPVILKAVRRNEKIREKIRLSREEYVKTIVDARREGPWVPWVYVKEKDREASRPGLAAGRVNPFLFEEEYFAKYGKHRRWSYHKQTTTKLRYNAETKWSYNLKEQ